VNALEVSHLGHRFGDRAALADISFAIPAGTFAVLLGLNGAGKTTLMSLAAGLYHAQSGLIAVFDHSLKHEPTQALARIGVVFQQPTLDLDLTVRENLRYHAHLHGMSTADWRTQQDIELGRLDLRDRIDEPARKLSGGLRRRVELARALLHRPALLLLDEATVGLDLATRTAILAHVRKICAERNVSVLWATHLLDEIDPADQLIVLHRGAVLYDAPASGLPPHAQTDGSIAEAFMRLVGGPA
jgi:ABC-2 type transport system ATP-binding protein